MSDDNVKEAILPRLQRIFQDVLDDDGFVLAPTHKPSDVPGWDSMSHIMIVTTLEQEFGLKFTNSEFEEMSSASGILDVLEKKL